MTILVDMDGVICTEQRTFERCLATEIPGARSALEALAAAGHTIVIYSARSWSELKMTEAWLQAHRIPYHGIHLGKPVADCILDDRSLRFSDWKTALAELGLPSAPLAD